MQEQDQESRSVAASRVFQNHVGLNTEGDEPVLETYGETEPEGGYGNPEVAPEIEDSPAGDLGFTTEGGDGGTTDAATEPVQKDSLTDNQI